MECEAAATQLVRGLVACVMLLNAGVRAYHVVAIEASLIRQGPAQSAQARTGRSALALMAAMASAPKKKTLFAAQSV